MHCYTQSKNRMNRLAEYAQLPNTNKVINKEHAQAKPMRK